LSNDITGALLGTGEPIVKFENVGDTVRGTVLSAEQVQQRDIDGNLKTWDNGDPRMQFVIKLATDNRDPDVDDDDGTRRLFTKWQMEQAVAAALRKAGVKPGDSIIGGTLVVKHSATKPSDKRGYNDTKLFEAAYRPPVKDESASLLGDEPAPAAAGPSVDDLVDI
jgi:hypothetical protein